MKGLIFFILLGWVFSFAAEFEVMTTDYPPYSYEKDGVTKGREIAVTYAMMEKMGYHNKIGLFSWSKAYSLTKDYPNYVLVTVARKKDRENLFKWVGPITVQDLILFEHSENPTHIKTLEETKKEHMIAVVKNFSTHQFLEKNGYTNLLMVENVTGLIKLLEHQRVDLIPFAPEVIPFVMHKNGLHTSLFQPTPVKLYTNTFYIAFSKNISDQEVSKWQNILDELKRSGKYESLQRKALQEALADYGVK